MNHRFYIANDGDSLVYTYGVGNKRIKAMQYSGGQLVRTTWYGDGFERVVEGSTEKFYHWIQSPDGPVALVIKVTGGATTIYYLCTDHLNSITGIMDASGNMQEEYSYDPWGRRRSPVSWLTDTLTAPVITTRGYTGHEHLDAFGLIHMNGRIYDPHLARVLNPDPIIQDPTDIQNYNRYSYCLNNPLKYTDPSGYISYKQSMDNTYGEGNYYYRGRGPKLLSYEEYMSSGNGGRGGVDGPFGLPYQGDNGSGDLGFYFDWISNSFRSTNNGNEMCLATTISAMSLNTLAISNLIFSGTRFNPFETFRGVIFANGGSWYTEDGAFPGTMIIIAQPTEQGDRPDGVVKSFSLDFAFGGGAGIEIGKVTDKNGGSQWFVSYNANIGYGLSFGPNVRTIKSVPESTFKASDYLGYSAGYSAGLFFIGGFYGGNKPSWNFTEFNDFGANFIEGGLGLSKTNGPNFGFWWSDTSTKRLFGL